MVVDPGAVNVRDFYRLMISCITPRPIAWVSTISPRGIPNLAPFSFFNGVGANPPAVVFCPVNNRHGEKKDTLINIEKTPEFVVNVVPFSLAKPMNDTSADLPYEVNEFEAAHVTPEPAVKVKPPRVKDAPVQMECVLHQIIILGTGPLGANLVVGRIVLLNISDTVLGADGQIDAQKLDTVGRMGGALYCRTTERFELPRPG